MTSRSPVNFRAFGIVAAFVIGAVMCMYLYMASSTAGIVVGAVYLAVLSALCAVFAIKYKRKTAKLRVLIAFAVSVVLCMLAFGFGFGYISSRSHDEENIGHGSVSGRVCSVTYRDGSYGLIIEDLIIKDKSVAGKMMLEISSSDNNAAEAVSCGDRVHFNGYVTENKLWRNGSVSGYSYRDDIRYGIGGQVSGLSIDFGKPTVLEAIRTGMYLLFIENMGERYGNIGYSMVTGDKDSLSGDISDTFSAAGLGHIMAVSGLHIGFLVLLLNFLLIKAGKKVKFCVVTLFLLAYCALVGFSPSVVRATIMTVVSMLAVFVGGRRDLLSSLCVSMSLILAFKPLYLFDVGFLLSFGSIYGIAMFANSIMRFLTRHKVHREVANGIGASTSVQIGITPLQAYYYGDFNLLAGIVNIVMIPYISITFMCMVVCLLIGAIPGCGAVLKISEYMLMPVDYVAQGIAAAPWSSIATFSTPAVFLCYPVMFCASEFFMMPKGKLSVFLASVAAYSTFCFIYEPLDDGVVMVASGMYNDSVVRDNGKIYVVGNIEDDAVISSMLYISRCKRIDAIYLYSMSTHAAEGVIEISGKYEIGAVYCCEFGDGGARLIDNGINFVYVDGTEAGDFSVAYYGGKPIGFEYEDILFARSSAEGRAFGSYGIVRVDTIYPINYYENTVYLCNYIEDDLEESDMPSVIVMPGGYSYKFRP